MSEEMELLIKLHKDGERQGPGSDAITRQALDIIGIDKNQKTKILDVGCGTGAQTITLAKNLNCAITAVDLFEPFLSKVSERFNDFNLRDKITTTACSMSEMPFNDEAFDLIWSEGAIYNIGFETGLKNWKRFAKMNGYIAVSEITWTTNSRPEEIESDWNNEYPCIGKASENIDIIEKLGYRFIGAFTLPEYCWEDMYYIPMEKRFSEFIKNNPGNRSMEIIKSEKKDIELYRKYKQYFSYVFYIMQKI